MISAEGPSCLGHSLRCCVGVLPFPVPTGAPFPLPALTLLVPGGHGCFFLQFNVPVCGTSACGQRGHQAPECRHQQSLPQRKWPAEVQSGTLWLTPDTS